MSDLHLCAMPGCPEEISRMQQYCAEHREFAFVNATPPPTIEQVKTWKHNMEQAILGAISEFEKGTGLLVSYLDVKRNRTYGSKYAEIFDVTATVELS